MCRNSRGGEGDPAGRAEGAHGAFEVHAQLLPHAIAAADIAVAVIEISAAAAAVAAAVSGVPSSVGRRG